jgi:hypothetical protein
VCDGEAAQVGRRGKAGHVPDHASANRDHAAAPIGGCGNEAAVDAENRAKMFRSLPVGDDDRGAPVQAAGKAVAVQPPDARARDNDPACGEAGAVQVLAKVHGEVVADEHRVVP